MTLQEIAQSIKIECDNTKEISGLSTLLDATQTEVTFLENKKYVNLQPILHQQFYQL